VDRGELALGVEISRLVTHPVLRKLRITEALAFDGAFAAAGFVELRP
jgi:hypothetical protein